MSKKMEEIGPARKRLDYLPSMQPELKSAPKGGQSGVYNVICLAKRKTSSLSTRKDKSDEAVKGGKKRTTLEARSEDSPAFLERPTIGRGKYPTQVPIHAEKGEPEP